MPPQPWNLTAQYRDLANNILDPTAMKANALALENAGNVNALNKLKIADFPKATERKERGLSQEDARIDISQNAQKYTQGLGALGAALKASNPRQARKIYDNLLPGNDHDIDFSYVGDKATVTTASGVTFTGPKDLLSETMEEIAKDPELLTDPTKNAHLMAYSAANGISITRTGALDPKAQAQLKGAADRAKGATKSAEKIAGMNIKSREKIADTAAKAKTTAASMAKAQKPDEKVKMAKSIIQMVKGKSDSDTGIMLAALIGGDKFDYEQSQTLRSQVPEDLRPMYDEAVAVLNEYLGAKTEPQANPNTGPAITHTFIPGQGLVPVTK